MARSSQAWKLKPVGANLIELVARYSVERNSDSESLSAGGLMLELMRISDDRRMREMVSCIAPRAES